MSTIANGEDIVRLAIEWRNAANMVDRFEGDQATRAYEAVVANEYLAWGAFLDALDTRREVLK